MLTPGPDPADRDELVHLVRSAVTWGAREPERQRRLSPAPPQVPRGAEHAAQRRVHRDCARRQAGGSREGATPSVSALMASSRNDK